MSSPQLVEPHLWKQNAQHATIWSRTIAILTNDWNDRNPTDRPSDPPEPVTKPWDGQAKTGHRKARGCYNKVHLYLLNYCRTTTNYHEFVSTTTTTPLSTQYIPPYDIDGMHVWQHPPGYRRVAPAKKRSSSVPKCIVHDADELLCRAC